MAKILISGLANTGKTSLLRTLEDVLVIANDGKKYPFKQPHVNVAEINTAAEFEALATESLQKYNDKFGHYPSTVVIDSISKTLLDIEAFHLKTEKGFPYQPINNNISEMMHFIENKLAKQGCNVIFVSHAFKNEDDLALVNAGGSWGKKGGVLSEVDEALYIEIRGPKRVVHLRNNGKLSRTLHTDFPESIPVEDFNLKDHLATLLANETDTDEWAL